MGPLKLFRSGSLDAAKAAKVKDEIAALKEVIDFPNE